MNVLSEIKSKIKDAMKSKDIVKRDILRLVVGQVQQSGDESDEAVIRVIKKIVKSNSETLDALAERNLQTASVGTPIVSKESEKILQENVILSVFIPQPMSEEAIEAFIEQNNIDIKSAKNDGQAMGMLMKPLQATGKTIDSFVVKSLISRIRSS